MAAGPPDARPLAYMNPSFVEGTDGRPLRILAEYLEPLGVFEREHIRDTIVFFYSDHGSGMPRSKRWPYDSGLRVPLILSIPEKYRAMRPGEYKAGAETMRPISFVDLAPTVLRLAGQKAAP